MEKGLFTDENNKYLITVKGKKITAHLQDIPKPEAKKHAGP